MSGARWATAAGITTLATQASVSLINNQGDIGQTLKDLGSSDSVKQLLTSMLTPGALNAVGGTDWMKQFNGTTITDRLVTQMVNSAVSATVQTAVMGGSYEDTLSTMLLTGGVNATAGWAAGEIGAWYADANTDIAGKYLAHKVAHALLGCAGAAAKGGDCASGAIGGAVGEAFAEMYGGIIGPETSPEEYIRVLQLSSLVAMAAAKVAGKDIYAAGDAAAIAVVNNYLAHTEAKALADAKARRDQCSDKACADAADREIKALQDLDRTNNEELKTACKVPASPACSQAMGKLADAVASYAGQKDGWDAYSIIDKERSEAITLANQYSIKATEAAAALRSAADLALDLSPAGDIKALAEAQTKLDVALALVGAIGPAGDLAKALIKEAKVLMEAGDAAKAAEKLTAAEKTVTASAGSKGSWDKAINGQLEPKSIYQLDNGHQYMTDSSGRVAAVEGKLSLTAMDRNTYQQCTAGKCGNIGDDGGHLIASSLGGAGDRINIVPQASTLNRGDWKAMENELRAALKDGKSVSVKIDVGYPAGGGVRPNQFQIIATVDGKIMPPRYFNQ
ncbi:DUF637 domain-containing protein [Parazoarcus communis]|uniref:DUF637 domain-containing protein n=1 Tax=Parazoarcus communis TaxID=41977 RepID=UPI001459A502